MKGKYSCPRCGANDWTPQTWTEIPTDKCNKCSYLFDYTDVPKEEVKEDE